MTMTRRGRLLLGLLLLPVRRRRPGAPHHPRGRSVRAVGFDLPARGRSPRPSRRVGGLPPGRRRHRGRGGRPRVADVPPGGAGPQAVRGRGARRALLLLVSRQRAVHAQLDPGRPSRRLRGERRARAAAGERRPRGDGRAGLREPQGAARLAERRGGGHHRGLQHHHGEDARLGPGRLLPVVGGQHRPQRPALPAHRGRAGHGSAPDQGAQPQLSQADDPGRRPPGADLGDWRADSRSSPRRTRRTRTTSTCRWRFPRHSPGGISAAGTAGWPRTGTPCRRTSRRGYARWCPGPGAPGTPRRSSSAGWPRTSGTSRSPSASAGISRGCRRRSWPPASATARTRRRCSWPRFARSASTPSRSWPAVPAAWTARSRRWSNSTTPSPTCRYPRAGLHRPHGGAAPARPASAGAAGGIRPGGAGQGRGRGTHLPAGDRRPSDSRSSS